MLESKHANLDAQAKLLRWKCRRGLAELDVLLERFFNERYHSLSSLQKEQFSKLLDQSDPVLLRWLMGQEEPSDLQVKTLVKLIRTVK